MNARIRKSFVYNDLNVGLVGAPVGLTYDYEHIGADTSSLDAIVSGKHSFTAKLAAAKNPMIIVGSGVNDLPDSEYVFSAVSKIDGQHKHNRTERLQRASACKYLFPELHDHIVVHGLPCSHFFVCFCLFLF